jgi:hypothetical protein
MGLTTDAQQMTEATEPIGHLTSLPDFGPQVETNACQSINEAKRRGSDEKARVKSPLSTSLYQSPSHSLNSFRRSSCHPLSCSQGRQSRHDAWRGQVAAAHRHQGSTRRVIAPCATLLTTSGCFVAAATSRRRRKRAFPSSPLAQARSRLSPAQPRLTHSVRSMRITLPSSVSR